MFSGFGILADWIIAHRWSTTLVLVGWTALMAVGHYDPSVLFPEPTYTGQGNRQTAEDTGFQIRKSVPVPDIEPLRVDLGNVIVVVRSEDFFSGQGVQAIRAVVSALEALDQVSSVVWMDRAPPLNIFSLSRRDDELCAGHLRLALPRAVEWPSPISAMAIHPQHPSLKELAWPQTQWWHARHVHKHA